MMFYTNIKNQGFSLVETLVAISILLLVVTGPMTISMRTAKSTSFATEQVQAFFLAQEGLELAQKGRDDLLLGRFLPSANPSYIANPWSQFSSTTGAFQSCHNSTGCGLQWSASSPTQLGTVINCSGSCVLYRTNSNVRSRFTYTATSNILTPFTRRIYFSNITGGVAIRSEVTWRTGSLVAEQKVTSMTYLYNIYALP